VTGVAKNANFKITLQEQFAKNVVKKMINQNQNKLGSQVTGHVQNVNF
jgi:hypothetical protein